MDARALLSFIDASPSPFHACATVAARLEAEGYREVSDHSAFPTDPGRYVLRRGGSLVAWAVAPQHQAADGFRIIGAHTDSPNLRLRPHPDTGGYGYRQLAVEVYGGALLNSWLDRDLGLSGRIVVRGPHGPVTQLILIDRPIARVPQLAIHLDREVSTTGLLLNPQEHLRPIWGLGDHHQGEVADVVAAEAGLSVDSILGMDLMLHDLTPSTFIGEHQDLISAPRLDNLCSSWAGMEALVAATDPAAPTTAQIPILALFDHEEVGSSSDRGAASPLLEAVTERIGLALGGGRDEHRRALAASWCCSADMAHATHPNYPERHEPGHIIDLDGGPVLKINNNQRYATDALSGAVFVVACEQANVPLQRYAHRGDLPCGSTIGPITATRMGIATFDVGAPQLAMHSARELCAADEPIRYARAMTAFLAPA